MNKIINELSKKYNKKDIQISKMIEICINCGYDLKTSKKIIIEFIKKMKLINKTI